MFYVEYYGVYATLVEGAVDADMVDAALSKATDCVTLRQTYDVNAQNHSGKTFLKDEKKASYFTKGYSGDVYCEDCGGFIESGADIDRLSIEVWPLEVWIAIGVLVIAVLFIIARASEDM